MLVLIKVAVKSAVLKLRLKRPIAHMNLCNCDVTRLVVAHLCRYPHRREVSHLTYVAQSSNTYALIYKEQRGISFVLNDSEINNNNNNFIEYTILKYNCPAIDGVIAHGDIFQTTVNKYLFNIKYCLLQKIIISRLFTLYTKLGRIPLKSPGTQILEDP